MFTYKQQKRMWIISFESFFSPRRIFVQSTWIILSYNENVLLFLLQLNMAKHGHFGSWNHGKNKLAKNKIRFDMQFSKGDLGACI